MDLWRAVLLSASGQEEQRAGEPLLAGIEELIDQILLDSERGTARSSSLARLGLLAAQDPPDRPSSPGITCAS